MLRLWPVFLAGPIVLSGLQSILPTLPLKQDELGLSNTEIELVTSVYLLPGVIFPVPGGMLTDRFGRRVVLSASLLVFGLGGLLMLSNPSNFLLHLGVRFVQGAAFASVLTVTITIIGDRFEGPLEVTAQGYRSLALKTGDAALPVIGGLLATITWYAPIATQLASLPLGVVVWRTLGDAGAPSGLPQGRVGKAIDLPRNPAVSTLLAAGFLRFIFKFAYLTYVPVLASGRGRCVLGRLVYSWVLRPRRPLCRPRSQIGSPLGFAPPWPSEEPSVRSAFRFSSSRPSSVRSLSGCPPSPSVWPMGCSVSCRPRSRPRSRGPTSERRSSAWQRR